ncbi:MAG TPA: putative zinc-binding peptidase [Polyangia bacterium]|nr:putative zinc-binding peptidase [Polyangia bacterium]
MNLFFCPACHQTLYFENSECTNCHHRLAFLPDRATLTALEPAEGAPEGVFVALGPVAKRARYRLCGNLIDHGACNWAVPESEPEQRFCRACRLNEVIPNLSDPGATQAWIKLEQNKRRLLYTLMQLGLPVESRAGNPERGLAFAFKQDLPGEEKVYIGHEHGLITINIAEADSPFREKTRLELGESYRTLLGHFRHEIGHYYWDRLIAGSPFHEPFRELFGDERASYEEAVKVHYKSGAPRDWPSRFVSSYASMHPWEDWAESWAHYLHMVDTLDTARSFGLALRPKAGRGDRDKLEVGTRRLDFDDFDDLEAGWVPLTIALNSLNRSMGLPDPYPFVLPQAALRKIRFVHDVVEKASAPASKAA